MCPVCPVCPLDGQGRAAGCWHTDLGGSSCTVDQREAIGMLGASLSPDQDKIICLDFALSCWGAGPGNMAFPAAGKGGI
jgi:hypothetical protein